MLKSLIFFSSLWYASVFAQTTKAQVHLESDPAKKEFAIISSFYKPSVQVDLGLSAIYQFASATRQITGQIKLNGTLDYTTNPVSYTPQPQGKFIAKLATGDSVEIDSFNITGDWSQSQLNDFLLKPHKVSYKNIKYLGNTWSGSSEFTGVNPTRKNANGIFAFGLKFETNILSAHHLQTNGGSFEYLYEDEIVSKLFSSDVDLNVREQNIYKLVSFDNAIENKTTVFNINGTIAGNQWQMNNAVLRRAWRDGQIAELEFWAQTGGELRKNNIVVGGIMIQQFPSPNRLEISFEANNMNEVLEVFEF